MQLPFVVKSFLPPEVAAEIEKLDPVKLKAALLTAGEGVARADARVQQTALDVAELRAEVAALAAKLDALPQLVVGAILQARQSAVNHG